MNGLAFCQNFSQKYFLSQNFSWPKNRWADYGYQLADYCAGGEWDHPVYPFQHLPRHWPCGGKLMIVRYLLYKSKRVSIVVGLLREMTSKTSYGSARAKLIVWAIILEANIRSLTSLTQPQALPGEVVWFSFLSFRVKHQKPSIYRTTECLQVIINREDE